MTDEERRAAVRRICVEALAEIGNDLRGLSWSFRKNAVKRVQTEQKLAA